MKKILLFHQPFPMGNYKLMPYIGKYLSNLGHEVYLLEQLNGKPFTSEYLDLVKSSKFDVVYYEMLDKETFKVIESLTESTRILCYASKGIFNDFESILSYSGELYDKVLTNSKHIATQLLKQNTPVEHFEYYPAPLNEEEITFDNVYNLDYVYLGGGFHRLKQPYYDIERKIIYNNPLVSKFGNGWAGVPNYRGILPSNDIGKLYNSSKYSLATIEPAQRSMGMINNRYSEIMKSGGTILSIDYKELEWFGAEEFITFVSDPNLLQYNPKINKQRQLDFILDKEQAFFNKLTSLL